MAHPNGIPANWNQSEDGQEQTTAEPMKSQKTVNKKDMEAEEEEEDPWAITDTVMPSVPWCGKTEYCKNAYLVLTSLLLWVGVVLPSTVNSVSVPV